MVITEKGESSHDLPIAIHLQTTDHIEAMEKVAEQAISRKYSKCKSILVKTDLLNVAKIPKTRTLKSVKIQLDY